MVTLRNQWLNGAAGITFFIGISGASANSLITPEGIDKKGNYQCELGDFRASRGEMPTALANQYWSHLACGQKAKAQAILDAAPKTADVPSPASMGNLKACFESSFPYQGSKNFASVQDPTRPSGHFVKHGFYLFDVARFSQLKQAVWHACLKLGH